MVTAYWIIVSLLFATSIVLSLTFYGVILKYTKLYFFLKNRIFISIVKRFLLALLTFFIITTFLFIITELMPKSYDNNYIANSPTLNDNSLLENLFKYYYDILPTPKRVCSTNYLENGDLYCSKYEYKLINLNYSYIYMRNTPVSTIIKERTSISFLVGIIAYIIQCIISYPLGIYIARKEGKLIDKSVCSMNAIVSVIPAVIYFYLFIIFFMVVLKLPVFFEVNDFSTYIAPICAVTISSSVSIAYFIRKYILIELNKDYVKFARSKGLNENTILYKHVLRNAIIPFIRTIPSSILMCFCGFYLLEAAFNIPGIGLTLFYSIKLKDIYLIRGILLYFSILYIIAYLIGDLVTIIYNKKRDLIEGDEKNERK